MKQRAALPLLLITALSLDNIKVAAFQPPSHFDLYSSCIPRSALLSRSFLYSVADYNDNDRPDMDKKAGIIFPGGGLFFYWQAGVIVSTKSCAFSVPITCIVPEITLS